MLGRIRQTEARTERPDPRPEDLRVVPGLRNLRAHPGLAHRQFHLQNVHRHPAVPLTQQFLVQDRAGDLPSDVLGVRLTLLRIDEALVPAQVDHHLDRGVHLWGEQPVNQETPCVVVESSEFVNVPRNGRCGLHVVRRTCGALLEVHQGGPDRQLIPLFGHQGIPGLDVVETSLRFERHIPELVEQCGKRFFPFTVVDGNLGFDTLELDDPAALGQEAD